MRGLVISVGGTPEPIRRILSELRPTEVLFVVSEQSRAQVDSQVLAQLDFTPQRRYVTVSEPENVTECYRQIRGGIRQWLAETRLRPEEVVVDITGGTKPMSAALALAAVEQFHHFTYVGGEKRDKDGLGVVVSGTERIVPTTNPWDELAVRELELARYFYERYEVGVAAEILRRAAIKAQRRKESLEVLADVCELFRRVDEFQFSNLYRDFKRRERALGVLFGDELRPTFEQLQQLAEHWRQLEDEKRAIDLGGVPGLVAQRTFLELIANAERRAAQGRFDDGAARLYRAVELAAQNALAEAFNARLGRLKLEQIPEDQREEFARQFANCKDDQGNYLLGVRNAFHALQFSPRPEHRALAAQYERLHPVLQRRNQSILAHGLTPVTDAGFQEFYTAVTELFRIDPQAIPRWPDRLLVFD